MQAPSEEREALLLLFAFLSGAGVPRSLKTTPPQDPTVGSCLGPYGGPRGEGGFV